MKSQTKRGDTMIEVLFGVAIFGLIAIGSIALMNNGLSRSEANLEHTMARNEMDAQAEAIRYIHSTYTATNSTDFADLWAEITEDAVEANNDAVTKSLAGEDCAQFYQDDGLAKKGFAIKTGTSIEDTNAVIRGDNITNSSANAYPIVNSSKAYNIWVNTVKGGTVTGNTPYYYDFYIRSCWYAPGSTTPTTLDTVLRLFNPAATPTNISTTGGSSTSNGNQSGGSTGGNTNQPSTLATVTFDPNGDGVALSESSRTVTKGNAIGPLPTATRNGYTFKGWYPHKTAETNRANQNTKIREDTTLYAHWTPQKYTLTFNPNGGTINGSSSLAVTSGNSIGSGIPSATRGFGFTFSGWYTSPTGGTKVDSNTKPTANATYYAHWGCDGNHTFNSSNTYYVSPAFFANPNFWAMWYDYSFIYADGATSLSALMMHSEIHTANISALKTPGLHSIRIGSPTAEPEYAFCIR